MRPLNLAMWRDLLHMRGQFTAVAVVVACGVASFVTSRSQFHSLLVSQTTYYEEFRFADLFLQVKRAPEAMRARIERLPGVNVVQTRVVREVTLDVPGLDEPATGRIVSVPEHERPRLNDVFIRRGRYIEPGRRDEVLISEPFADANTLAVGDAIGAVINGRWERLRIVGIALSPEYIYAIPSGSLFPDNRRFGILWMSRDAVGPAFDMEAAFNDLSLSITAAADTQAIIARLDTLMAPYGALGAYTRDDHVSHTFISDEIEQNEVQALIVPAIFLGVAAFLLNVVLTRLVTMQREQIALLKAFGYADTAIGLHYVKLVMVPVLVGATAGTGIGLWAGSALTGVYAEFYRFPVLRFGVGFGVLAVGYVISAVTAVVGATSAVRRVASLPPAEAMRPEPPATFRPGWLERIGLQRLLPVPGRIILRHLERHAVKSSLNTLGIAMAAAIMVVGLYFMDAVKLMGDVQFRMIHREDVTITFGEPQAGRVRHDLMHLPGVRYAEPFRLVPVRLSHEHRSRRTGLLGLRPGSTLLRIVDKHGHSRLPPPRGMLLTSLLGDLLRVGVGDTVTVEVMEAGRPVRRVVVAGLVDELIGTSAYMEIGTLHRVMREANTISGAFLAVDPTVAPLLYARLKDMPAVQGVAILEAAAQSFEDTLAQSIRITTGVLALFASAIAVGVIYNGARISLSERGRELGSLRVLGFTRTEVGWILLGEQGVLTLSAIPLGFGLGYGISALMPLLIKSELYRLPLYVSGTTFAFSFMVVVVAAAASGYLVRRRLDRLDLIAVLKTRE